MSIELQSAIAFVIKAFGWTMLGTLGIAVVLVVAFLLSLLYAMAQNSLTEKRREARKELW